MKSLVISLGGSVLLSEHVTAGYLDTLFNLFTNLSQQYKLYIVVGGGPPARRYIKLARQLNMEEQKLDELGILITRVNARFLTMLLKKENTNIPQTIEEATKINESIVIMGGTTPGHSTDMVGAELAERVHAVRFINATNVDGIYDKDPNKYKDAKQLQTVHIDTLIDQYGTGWESAGKNVVIDGPALEIIKRAKLATFVVNGMRPEQLGNAMLGKTFNGTKIQV